MNGDQVKGKGVRQPMAALGEFFTLDRMKDLDWAGKTVAWYCLVGPQSKAPGVFVINADKACEDLRTTKEDWNFYLELVADELGWRWDSERNLLWITDYFSWVKVSKSVLLGGLQTLPETPWREELAAEPPAALSPMLQAVWRQWFFPVEPVEPTAEEIALASIPKFSELTPAMIPLVARRYLRRNTPAYIVQEFEVFLRVRSDFIAQLNTPDSPPMQEDPLQFEAG